MNFYMNLHEFNILQRKKITKTVLPFMISKKQAIICVNTSEWAITGLYSQAFHSHLWVNVKNYFAALLQVRFNITEKLKNLLKNLS